jgi:hypothetical protein
VRQQSEPEMVRARRRTPRGIIPEPLPEPAPKVVEAQAEPARHSGRPSTGS